MQSTNRSYSKPITQAQPGFSPIYRHSSSFQTLQQTPLEHISSLRQLNIELFTKKYSNRPFLGKIIVDQIEEGGQKKQIRKIGNILTYKQSFDIAVKLSSACIKNKLIHKQNDLSLIGIYSPNRQEFILADLAFLLFGITSVPLYNTLGLDNLVYCLEHSNIISCICGTDNVKTLLGRQSLGNLKNVILYEKVEPELEAKIKARLNLYYFWDLIEQEKQPLNYEDYYVNPDQCFTFSYTSGTTGKPKAAMLTQKNVLSFIAGYKIQLTGLDRNSDNQVHLCILPLPHAFERIIISYEFFIGSFIVIPSGNLLKLKDDIALVKPTQLIMVPRIYNKFIQEIINFCQGEDNLRKMIEEKSPKIQAIKQLFGGRVKYLMTGSAPISAKVIELFRKIMQVPFSQGYGQTQNTGGAFMQSVFDDECAKVGTIWPNLEFKLCDIPEMGYTAKDVNEKGQNTPRGQIWLRGPGIFKGYYKSQQLTKQALTEDGWLRTGDVGALTAENNSMKIIDRVKNIFKLAQGQYVAAEKVESQYVKSKYVVECYLHGDSLQNFAVLIITPNLRQIEILGKQLGIQKSGKQLIEDKKIIKSVLDDLVKIGKANGLYGFEQAHNLRFQSENFALRGIVSSTFKLQRFMAKKAYEKQIAEMYAQGPI